MLIDALRCDFVYTDTTTGEKNRMPFLNRLWEEKRAVGFKLMAKSPTVTLPRLKALLTGVQPQFIDVLWNFNTTRLSDDNWLRQFKLANKSILFYGDDTWLRLFDPLDMFTRYDGTHSFIASDYDQVCLEAYFFLSFFSI